MKRSKKKCKQQARTDCAVVEVYNDRVIVITYTGTLEVEVEKAKNLKVLSGFFTVEECSEG